MGIDSLGKFLKKYPEVHFQEKINEQWNLRKIAIDTSIVMMKFWFVSLSNVVDNTYLQKEIPDTQKAKEIFILKFVSFVRNLLKTGINLFFNKFLTKETNFNIKISFAFCVSGISFCK
jgi:hypothetical protein